MAQFGTVTMQEASRGITINIKLVGVRAWTLRLRAAIFVLRIAGLISPIPMAIDTGHEART